MKARYAREQAQRPEPPAESLEASTQWCPARTVWDHTSGDVYICRCCGSAAPLADLVAGVPLRKDENR